MTKKQYIYLIKFQIVLHVYSRIQEKLKRFDSYPNLNTINQRKCDKRLYSSKLNDLKTNKKENLVTVAAERSFYNEANPLI